MKKSLATMMTLAMSASLLAGCGATAVVTETTTAGANTVTEAAVEETKKEELAEVAEENVEVKTGLAISTSLSGENATADADGAAKADIALTAVTVDEDGVIQECVIDAIQTNITFSAKGALTNTDAEFLSKNELGEAYGMKKFSGIGKEWNEQAAAMAEYAVGKTVEELREGAITETGTAKDADLASSATIYLGGFVNDIEEAVKNAEYLGAKKDDTLALTSTVSAKKSKDASAEGDGLAQAYATVAVVTMNEDVISSCLIDAVQANVNFKTDGTISSDLTAEVLTKNELGENYGMKKASSIGKEWFEQAAAFSEYVEGKTAEEVAGIAVTDKGKAGDVDLASSVTVSIGDFKALIEKAVQ